MKAAMEIQAWTEKGGFNVLSMQWPIIHENEREEMGLGARRHIQKYFGLIADEYMALYQRLSARRF